MSNLIQKRSDLIRRKIADVQDMVASLRRNPRHYKLGFTSPDDAETLAFEERRLALLQWCAEATVEAITEQLTRMDAALGPVGRALKYGTGGALDLAQADPIAMVEILELALGIHPALQTLEGA